MPKYTITFTRVSTETFEKTVSAKDYEAALEKGAEIQSEKAEWLDGQFDKEEKDVSYEMEATEE